MAERITSGRWLKQVLADRAAKSTWTEGLNTAISKDIPGHVCQVNGDCLRFLELWNLVFIQYNRLSPTQLEPLPARHVDTGMGFERIVSVLQDVDSNYRTDLLWSLILTTQELTGQTDEQREANFTPYRVIADHARAAAFLIADGVVPGNKGRNYVTRMIIRRAYRFGGKIGLHEPFLARVAEKVIQNYGDFYPELKRNQKSILISITREEEQFQRTLGSGDCASLKLCLMRFRNPSQNESCQVRWLGIYTPPTVCRSRSPAISPENTAWMWMSTGYKEYDGRT